MTGADLLKWLAKQQTTQTEFSKLIDISRVQVSRWCNGHVAVPRVIEIICVLNDELDALKQKDQKD